jgi:hypothetical protein
MKMSNRFWDVNISDFGIRIVSDVAKVQDKNCD